MTLTRQGDRIVVKYIQASFGSINRNDITTIELKKGDSGYLLVADVCYRPSVAFWIIFILTIFSAIGWLIPIAFYLMQKNTVKDAIRDAFKRVRDECETQSKTRSS